MTQETQQWNFSEYPDNWNEIREIVLARDGYRCRNPHCQHNNPTIDEATLHVHHIVPLSKGGTSTLENLITLCEYCHAEIHPHMQARYQYASAGSKKYRSYYDPKTGEWYQVSDSPCFIATAVYGESLETNLLREWKKNRLEKSTLGNFLIQIYYILSPYLTKHIKKSEKRRNLAKKALKPLVSKLK